MNISDWLQKADDSKPGESLGETSTEELTQTHKDLMSRLKDLGDSPEAKGLQTRHASIVAELKKRGKDPMGKACGETHKSMDLGDWIQKAKAVPDEDEPMEKFLGKILGGGKGGEGSRGGKIIGHDSHGKPIYARQSGSIAMTGSGKHVTAAKHHDRQTLKNRSPSDEFRSKHGDWESHDHHDAAHAHEKMATTTKDKKLRQHHQTLAQVHRQVATGKEHDERKAGGRRGGAKVASKRQK
jgi:hypothetical protein